MQLKGATAGVEKLFANTRLGEILLPSSQTIRDLENFILERSS